ncbi:MAG: nucleoside triphosphate pyrophosphohydrolase [Gammaproteobacteria bacterium]|nr:nucleoside triphosphate pyrophosphohydrolase [Gammaproteobacteria bacterium]
MNHSDFKKRSPIEQLIIIMSMLRDREFGCPWDLEQSFHSLIPYTLEEVYEVVDALEQNDMHGLEDELGDLLFQVIFYAQIANEEELFSFDDVANAIVNKLVRRHPHVFPDGDVENFGSPAEISSDQVVINWEQIKNEEKKSGKGTLKRVNVKTSELDDIPVALPSLDRSRKLQKRAARVGFDWQSLPPVLSKLKEEIAELEDAISMGQREDIQAELGDVLFTVVNVARHTQVDAEAALRSANKRFENRFKWVEAKLLEQGKTFEQAQLKELNRLWEKAKAIGL